MSQKLKTIAPVQDLSLPSPHNKYDIIIVGSGNRAKLTHEIVCQKLRELEENLTFAAIPGRAFRDLSSVEFESKLWIFAVPPKLRMSAYLKLTKNSLFIGKNSVILTETPSTPIDCFFSLLPFTKIRIAEVAYLPGNLPIPKHLWSRFSYTDKRLGEDHSYGVYFRYTGLLIGLVKLLNRKIYLKCPKDDKLGFKVEVNNELITTYMSAEERVENEIKMLKSVYKNLLSGNSTDIITFPFVNFILKKLFLIFVKKI